jgi:acetylornithine deacetylase
VGRWLAVELHRRGYAVVEQRVDGERLNVYASVGSAAVTFSTHVDCVPPYVGPRVEGGRLYGRGACDAKGIAAAQIAAADALRASGMASIGLLFVVGEERGSDGAKRANADARPSRYLINGEPTDCRLGLATRGIQRVLLKATGRAAHSSYPELGDSAIDKLLDVLIELRRVDWPTDPVLGRTHYIVGLISGGVAPNVIPPMAEAELMFRTVSDAATIREVLAQFEPRVSIEPILEVPPVRMITIPGVPSAVFPYTTDIPFLGNWGAPLLYGPGSIHVAHTDDEFIEIAEQQSAVDGYVSLARELLARPS